MHPSAVPCGPNGSKSSVPTIELLTNSLADPGRLTFMQKIYSIHAEWDDKANVWVATSEDVPGLATESETFELLMKKLEVMVPELLELNGVELTHEVSFELLAHRIAVAQVQTH